MTRADTHLLVALVLLAALSVPLVAHATRVDGTATLQGPSGTTRIELARDATFVVDGRIGEVTFQVRDGAVRCAASDCPDQICVDAPAMSSTRPIVCAPNGVIARLAASGGDGEFDAVSR